MASSNCRTTKKLVNLFLRRNYHLCSKFSSGVDKTTENAPPRATADTESSDDSKRAREQSDYFDILFQLSSFSNASNASQIKLAKSISAEAIKPVEQLKTQADKVVLNYALKWTDRLSKNLVRALIRVKNFRALRADEARTGVKLVCLAWSSLKSNFCSVKQVQLAGGAYSGHSIGGSSGSVSCLVDLCHYFYASGRLNALEECLVDSKKISADETRNFFGLVRSVLDEIKRLATRHEIPQIYPDIIDASGRLNALEDVEEEPGALLGQLQEELEVYVGKVDELQNNDQDIVEWRLILVAIILGILDQLAAVNTENGGGVR